MYCRTCGAPNDVDARFCTKCGNNINGTNGIGEAAQSARNIYQAAGSTGVAYAGFWRRFAAYIIDSIILAVGGALIGGVIGFIIGIVLAVSGTETEIIRVTGQVVGVIVGLVLNWLYFTLFEASSKQGTIGKSALGIIVTDESGQRISLGKANARYWSKIVSAIILGIGFLMVAFTEKKQGLHDIMAGTLVVLK
jgi:uncharacterized RDD family membrane protein YckC